ncbi:TetR/AcrR family transcriptional regulator [Phenylobacterium sp.]|uniref:TetR/AcrR family transcriptional regulator n=1 Tax=Phenylobacterium sp. TaxID=1871053 RepID=UPI0035B18D23
MKHLTGNILPAGETEVRVPTRRALAKQQTRAKVLAAARRLFSEQGFDGATIRDIAAAAGMSTGAVFANFADKTDLFHEIMIADIAMLAEEMRAAASRGKTVDEALLKIFMAGYSFYKGQLPLARAAFSVSWTSDHGRVLRKIEPAQVLIELIADELNAGAARGELSRECEVRLRSQMLFDCYLSNYPQAIFDGWSLDALQTRSRDQIRVVLAGARRG